MKLISENINERRNATASDVSGLFADPKRLGSFVILDNENGGFIQAATEPDGTCVLEYRDETLDVQFQATERETLAATEAAFLDYLDGGQKWRTSREWKRLELNSSGGCRKQASLLIFALILSAVLGSAACFASFAAQQQQPDANSPQAHEAASQLPRTPSAEEVSAALAKVLGDKQQNYGLVAGVQLGDQLVVSGAAGVRKKGDAAEISVADKLHLGSCSKAFTATLAGVLVDAGQIRWEATLPELFPGIDVHPDFRLVTLDQLLSHRSGLPRDVSRSFQRKLSANATPREQRRQIAAEYLAAAPEYEPGSKMEYSNLGYILIAAAEEACTDTAWEDLLRDKLFAPLGMTSAGLGQPAHEDDAGTPQPWGHSSSFLFGTSPTLVDNPAYHAPAGAIHCSLADWGKFAALHLGHQPEGKQLLSAETLKHLHTPRDGTYMAGWVITQQPAAGGTVYLHDGSNTNWFAVIRIVPGKDLAIMAVTNSGEGDLPNTAIAELLRLCELVPPAK